MPSALGWGTVEVSGETSPDTDAKEQIMGYTRLAVRGSASALALVLLAGCGDDDPSPATAPSASPQTAAASSPTEPAGYVVQVTTLCRDLLADVMAFDIGNAVTIEQFLDKHDRLVVAIRDFDARVDAIPVAEAEQPAAAAFDAYRQWSDAADAKVVAAARTGDQQQFDAANEAFIEELHSNPPEIEAMRAAGIQCTAR
jgi:hypothetical protein